MTEHLVLGDERRRDVLRDHEPMFRPPSVVRNAGSPRQRRIHESLDPSLRDACELGHRHRQRVEREGERLPVEVAVRYEQSSSTRTRGLSVAAFNSSRRLLDVVEEVARCAVHLRRAPQRIRVLHLVAPAMRLDDRGALEQAEDVRAPRPPARGSGRSAWICGQKARARPLQRLERQCARVSAAPRADARERARARRPPP